LRFSRHDDERTEFSVRAGGTAIRAMPVPQPGFPLDGKRVPEPISPNWLSQLDPRFGADQRPAPVTG
jgi:hypothetical protein